MVAKDKGILEHKSASEIDVLIGRPIPNHFFPRDFGSVRFADGAVHLVLLGRRIGLSELDKDLLWAWSGTKAIQECLAVECWFRRLLFASGFPEEIDERKNSPENKFYDDEDRFEQVFLKNTRRIFLRRLSPFFQAVRRLRQTLRRS